MGKQTIGWVREHTPAAREVRLFVTWLDEYVVVDKADFYNMLPLESWERAREEVTVQVDGDVLYVG